MRDTTNPKCSPVNDAHASNEHEVGDGELPGIVAELGALPPGAVVNEDGVAKMFNRCGMSVKRAVERGELPRPTRLFGKNTWTARIIIEHIEHRLAEAAKEHANAERRTQQLRP